MELSELQTTSLLREYGVPLPPAAIATDAEEARQSCASIGGKSWVVKAGLRPDERVGLEPRIECASADAVGRAAGALLGQEIDTAGATEGPVLTRVMIESVGEVSNGWYIGMALDRVADRVVLLGSILAGQSITDIADKSGSGMAREEIDPFLGLQRYQSRRFLLALGLPNAHLRAAADALANLYHAFASLEATAVEVSRFNLEGDRLVARDVTLLFDHGALNRNPHLRTLMEESGGSRHDAAAAEWDLRHVAMSGTVGLLVSGSGLGAATMGLLEKVGLAPSGIVDLGTGATAEAVAAGIRLVMANPATKSVLVNVFAGFNRCDHVAEGVVRSVEEVGDGTPVVVRLNGNRVRDGVALLGREAPGVAVTVDLEQAVEHVASAVRAAGETGR